jgi:hypothetical protein
MDNWHSPSSVFVSQHYIWRITVKALGCSFWWIYHGFAIYVCLPGIIGNYTKGSAQRRTATDSIVGCVVLLRVFAKFRTAIISLVNKTNLMHKFIFSICINLYMFRATINPSSGETTVYATLGTCYSVWCGWLSRMQGRMKQSSTQNNKYQVSHKHSCFSWWWAHSCPKHVEIDKYKYTKKKLCTKLVLFTRLYRDGLSTKRKIWRLLASSCLFVCLYVRMEHLGYTEEIFMKYDIWVFSSFNWNLIRITSTLHEHLCTFMIISRSVLLRMRSIPDKSYKRKHTHFMFSNCCPENHTVCDINWKVW